MNIKELARRYSMSQQGMRQYLQKRMDEINIDGEHVKMDGHRWRIDEQAVRRLDEMRGYSPKKETATVVVERSDGSENLREQMQRMTELMLIQQAEWRRREIEMETLSRQLNDTQRQLTETTKQLTETLSKLEQFRKQETESQGNWLSRLWKRIKK